MSQEATIIALDNSYYMLNGDFIPNRFLAQKDALSLICGNKKRLNPENTVGLVTLSHCQVICTLTSDVSKVYSKASQIVPDGDITFCTSIAIAHLALRNRQARNQKPKIFIFIGSPIEDSDEELIKIARRLKKEKVTVTIVSFGEAEYNIKKLTTFIEVLNGKDCFTSQILSIPQGSSIQEHLRVNREIMGETSGVITNARQDLGFDEIDDPDLEYALRISLEEQRIIQSQQTAPELIIITSDAPISADETRLKESVIDTTINPSLNLDPNNNLQGMTEEEQISYALSMSMVESEQKETKVDKIKKRKKSHEYSSKDQDKNKNNRSIKKRKK